MNKTSRDSVARDLFIQRLRQEGHQIDPDTVIARENVYRVDGQVNLMVRTSRFHETRGIYFFGLTRHIFENFVDLPHPVLAFVFSDSSEALLVPAKWMWDQRDRLSADIKQYKVELDKAFRLKLLKDAGGPIDMSSFHEKLEILSPSSTSAPDKPVSKAVSDKHSELQGMLLEVGNVRGFQTYCPNKSPRFKNRPLGEISTVKTFPEFPGLNNDIVKQIDVIWLDRSFPLHAFEVELTTGIWSGLVRLGELRRLYTVFHVVTNDDGKGFRRRAAGDIFTEIIDRCHHANESEIRELFDVETRLGALRKKLSL